MTEMEHNPEMERNAGLEHKAGREHKEDAIDNLLRRSMAAPIPSLPRDFDQRVLRALQRSSQPLSRYRQAVITSYGVVSVVVCTVLMRGQGLAWATVAGTILGPLVLLAATIPLWPRTKTVIPN